MDALRGRLPVGAVRCLYPDLVDAQVQLVDPDRQRRQDWQITSIRPASTGDATSAGFELGEPALDAAEHRIYFVGLHERHRRQRAEAVGQHRHLAVPAAPGTGARAQQVGVGRQPGPAADERGDLALGAAEPAGIEQFRRQVGVAEGLQIPLH